MERLRRPGARLVVPRRPRAPCGAPTGGRLPMGLAVGPRVGPDYLVVGDAGGSINPFNGEGIAYGYETGRLAAAGDRARASPPASSRDSRRLRAAPRAHLRPATTGSPRAFMALMSGPTLMRGFIGTGMHSKTLMDWVLRIMSNTLREDELGTRRARLPGRRRPARRARHSARELHRRRRSDQLSPAATAAAAAAAASIVSSTSAAAVGERGEGDLVGARRQRHPAPEHLAEERRRSSRPRRPASLRRSRAPCSAEKKIENSVPTTGTCTARPAAPNRLREAGGEQRDAAPRGRS